MSKYTIRIQMDSPDRQNLETLEQEMSKETFLPIGKTNTTGTEKTATFSEYSYSGKMSLTDLNAFIARSGKKTGKKFSFTIIKEKSQILIKQD